MARLLLLGGTHRRRAGSVAEWQRFDEAVILRVETGSGAVSKVRSYRSPPDCCPDEGSFVFKAGTLAGRRLFACTQTEILEFETDNFSIRRRISLPCFNDLHHVLPRQDGTLLAANTGLDMTVQISRDGSSLIEAWNVMGADPWERFDPETDYRLVPTTKPHLSHPNYIFEHEGQLWVTRFEQRDAVPIRQVGRNRIPVDVERPHDGVSRGDSVYFTTVDGKLIRSSAACRTPLEVFDLGEMEDRSRILGWCRGLCFLSDREVLVGFSRLRPTVIKENVKWLARQLRLRDSQESGPTRIALYDLSQRRLRWEIPVESSGMNAIFSIHLEDA